MIYDMPTIALSEDQENALNKMRVGCILDGKTGSGKSRTGLAYYYTRYGGQVNVNKYVKMKNPKNLYIITTAKKRDTLEWESELGYFYLNETSRTSLYPDLKIVIDSWNNIQKYIDVKDAFFIFDEQRVVGYGIWVKSFLKIASKNAWILLTATPGDTWMDYIPVFIANGFFKNKTDFTKRHVVYSRFANYPKVEKYIDEARLLKYRNAITVELKYEKHTVSHHIDILCNYDKFNYDYVVHNKWNIFKDKPIENAGEYCLVLRQIVNSDIDRQQKVLDIVKKHKKVIIFYSYDYELEILRNLFKDIYPFTEWNGHKHEELLTSDQWVYLVQYAAGSEAWNCITTDTMIFFSQNYSYKMMVQAAGRIDRRNTPYNDLYYYHLISSSKIDGAIGKALKRKSIFSEKGFSPKFSKDEPSKNPPPRQLSLFDFIGGNSDIHSDSEASKRFPDDYCEIYCNWEDPNNPQYDPEWVKTHEKFSNINLKKE